MKTPSIFFFILLSVFLSFSSQAQNLWAVNIGGTNNDRCNAVATDASGNVYMTGWFQGNVDFDPGPATNNISASGNFDIFVLKLDASGNHVWAKKLGGANNEVGNSIAVDGNGNVYTTGYFEGTVDFDPGTATYNLTSPGGNSDAFICKLNSSGNFVWAKKIGDTNLEEGLGIAVDGSGNVYTTGYFSSTNTDFDPGAGTFTINPGGFNDAYISKLDVNGNFVWAKAFSGPNYEVGNAIAVDGAGNVYTTGSFRGNADFDPGAGSSYLISQGFKDIFVCKLNSSGNFVWAKRMGDANDDEGLSIACDATGNVYTTGYFMGAPDFDPGAGTTTLTSNGAYDIFISKLNSSGTYVWAKSIGASTEDCGKSIAVDALGNVYTTGYFYSTADFDPGAGSALLTPAGNNDAFLSKLDVNGNFVWAKKMGGSSFDFGNSLALDPSGNIVAAGYFQGTGDFDPGSGIFNLTSAGSYDGYICKSQNITDVVSLQGNDTKLKIYPNPASDIVWIKGNEINSVAIYSVLGRELQKTSNVSSGEVIISINSLEQGLYYLKVQEGNNISIVSFVKQ